MLDWSCLEVFLKTSSWASVHLICGIDSREIRNVCREIEKSTSGIKFSGTTKTLMVALPRTCTYTPGMTDFAW
jgi:hypothetical protein